MNCKDVREQLSVYIDDFLDKDIKEKIENHLEECKSCKEEYEDLITIKSILGDVPTVELPKGFKEELHSKLVNYSIEDNSKDFKEDGEIIQFKNKQSKFIKSKFNWKMISAIAASILLIIVSIGGLKNYIHYPQNQFSKEMVVEESKKDYALMPEVPAPKQEIFSIRGKSSEINVTQMDVGSSELDYEVENNGISQGTLVNNGDRKVILNGYIELNVEKYDKVQQDIINLVTSIGGYVENSFTSYKFYNRNKPEDSLKTGNLIVRIPDEQFYGVFSKIKGMGIALNERINSSDITEQYRDTVNEIENLKVREKRLREIMDKAENVKEIIEVERELSRVRGEINRYTGNIKKWDSLVSLSRIEISLNEVEIKDNDIKPIDENLWQKAKKGFIETTNNIIDILENIIVSLKSLLPIILVVSGLLLIILYLYNKKNNNNNKR